MGSNLQILDDWVKGQNFRPASIHFHTEKEKEQQEKEKTPIGEIWTDSDGKQWKRLGKSTWSRVGTVLDILKETNPNCKCCGKEIDYKHRHDVTSYHRSKFCFDCIIEVDNQRKLDGTFKLYEQKFVLEKQRDYVVDMLAQLKDGINHVDDNIEFINEFGDREKWSGIDTTKLKEDMQRDIDEGEKALIDIANGLEKVNFEISNQEDKDPVKAVQEKLKRRKALQEEQENVEES